MLHLEPHFSSSTGYGLTRVAISWEATPRPASHLLILQASFRDPPKQNPS